MAFFFIICSLLSADPGENDEDAEEVDVVELLDPASVDLIDEDEVLDDLLMAAKPARPIGLLLWAELLDAELEPLAEADPVDDPFPEDEELAPLADWPAELLALFESKFVLLNGKDDKVDDPFPPPFEPLPPLEDPCPDEANDCSICCLALTKCIADSLPIFMAAWKALDVVVGDSVPLFLPPPPAELLAIFVEVFLILFVHLAQYQMFLGSEISDEVRGGLWHSWW